VKLAVELVGAYSSEPPYSALTRCTPSLTGLYETANQPLSFAATRPASSQSPPGGFT